MKTEKTLADEIEQETKKKEAVKPKIIYNMEDTVIQEIAIDKNLVLRVIDNANGRYIDIRRFYKNYPTKKGIRFSYGIFDKLKSLLV